MRSLSENDQGELVPPEPDAEDIEPILALMKGMLEPLARAEEIRATESTKQVAMVGWLAGELTIGAILTHFGAIVTGYAIGKAQQG